MKKTRLYYSVEAEDQNGAVWFKQSYGLSSSIRAKTLRKALEIGRRYRRQGLTVSIYRLERRFERIGRNRNRAGNKRQYIGWRVTEWMLR